MYAKMMDGFYAQSYKQYKYITFILNYQIPDKKILSKFIQRLKYVGFLWVLICKLPIP